MLTPEQIQKIDRFFEENGLSFYDLRQELVDHLSQSIEEQMKTKGEASFERLFEQEKKKFSRKELTLQNLGGIWKYDARKEWKYFKGIRGFYALMTFLLLVSPILFLSFSQLLYVELAYLIATTGYLLSDFLVSRKTYKKPLQKLSFYGRGTVLECLLPTLWLTYEFFKPFTKEPGSTNNASFFFFVGFVVIIIMERLVRSNYRRQNYKAAFKAYPFLFQSK